MQKIRKLDGDDAERIFLILKMKKARMYFTYCLNLSSCSRIRIRIEWQLCVRMSGTFEQDFHKFLCI